MRSTFLIQRTLCDLGLIVCLVGFYFVRSLFSRYAVQKGRYKYCDWEADNEHHVILKGMHNVICGCISLGITWLVRPISWSSNTLIDMTSARALRKEVFSRWEMDDAFPLRLDKGPVNFIAFKNIYSFGNYSQRFQLMDRRLGTSYAFDRGYCP